ITSSATTIRYATQKMVIARTPYVVAVKSRVGAAGAGMRADGCEREDAPRGGAGGMPERRRRVPGMPEGLRRTTGERSVRGRSATAKHKVRKKARLLPVARRGRARVGRRPERS